MRFSETVVLVLFVIAVIAVYVFAAVIVLGAIRRRLEHRKLPASRRRRAARISILALAVVGIACMAYGYFIEPYWLETTHVTLSSEKLAGLSRPLRIVHISDLHCEEKQRLEGRLPEVIRQIKPDVIVFTGDALNSRGGLVNLKTCMKRLAEIAPTFAVDGNMDVRRFPDTDIFADTRVRLLDGEAVKVSVDQVQINLVGGPAGRWQTIENVLKGLKGDLFTVVLYHYPGRVTAASGYPVDLYLAGHTHGGQVALPGYGALITLSRLGKKYESGRHPVGKTWLYVNRGIGMEGGSAPRVRFWARPEVTVIEISPAGEGREKPREAASAPTRR
ncbi:MAG: metallophosphoesterase [Planctomycetota bacterium]